VKFNRYGAIPCDAGIPRGARQERSRIPSLETSFPEIGLYPSGGRPHGRKVGLSGAWMGATYRLGGQRFRTFAIEIEPVLLPVHRPTLFNRLYMFGGGDAEPQERQDHGTKADVGLRAFANVPTPRTP
jgi:hypothetical protein